MAIQRDVVSVGALRVRAGAAEQFTAPVRVRESTEPEALMVATAVGRVVQEPPVTCTVGAVVYPPPPWVIFAKVPALFDSAVAVFGQILNPSLHVYSQPAAVLSSVRRFGSAIRVLV